MSEQKPTPQESLKIGSSPIPGLILSQELRGHTGGINCIVWSPDGNLIATPSEDKSIRIWDGNSGACLHTLEGHTGEVNHVAWSPDGKRIASAAADNTICLWDAINGSYWLSLEGLPGNVYCVSWSPDGQRLASFIVGGTIVIWEVEPGIKNEMIIRNRDRSNYYDLSVSGAWSPDGQHFAYTDRDTIRLIDFVKGTEYRTIKVPGEVYGVYWSSDGQQLASVEHPYAIRIWNANSGIEILSHIVSATNRHIPLRKNSNDVAWSHDGQYFAITGYQADIIDIWVPTSGTTWRQLEGHTDEIIRVSFSPNGRWLVSEGISGLILWRCDNWGGFLSIGEPRRNTKVCSRCFTTVERIASFCHNCGSLLGEYHIWPRNGQAFNPRLPVIAILAEDDTIIRLWRLDEYLLLGEMLGSVHYTTAKVVLVGDSGVGKTGLGWRLAHNEFKEHESTHGQQFWLVPQLGLKRKDNTECEAVLWDLAGQHIYRQIHSIFLENVAAALVVFDPSNRQDPLKGVEFWLEQLKGKGQLPPTILVGGRIDRGAPTLGQEELDQFCQRFGVSGGYISTSAKSNAGMEMLLETLKTQLPWDQMTATVTTLTFKRIKDFVLSLKENPNRQSVLVSPLALRSQLQETDRDWNFTDDEMMTAVGHLENHGYVAILRSSTGQQHILLAPDLLVNLASSIYLQADNNPRQLGAISENELLKGNYPFEEIKRLVEDEKHILLNAAITRFLEHNICFREAFGNETLLIFPGLIKQKRPLFDDTPVTDDISYIVNGRIENLYAMLVVLIGYSSSFTRVNVWQNQVQYEMGAGELCGFRLFEDRQGEIELVLYYGDRLSTTGRAQFRELFEYYLYQRDVSVTPFPPVVCPNGHRQERVTVINRVREGITNKFCDTCGAKTDLPNVNRPRGLGIEASPWLLQEEAKVGLRRTYELYLAKIKSYRRDRATPRCYISLLPAQAKWAEKLIQDLLLAGVFVVEQAPHVQPDDFVIVLDTPSYQRAFNTTALEADAPLVRARLRKRQLISLTITGQVNPHKFNDCTPGSFCDETHYPVSLFDLVMNLYLIPFDHIGFAPLRQTLHGQWEKTATRMPISVESNLTTQEKPSMNYQDFQILVTTDRKIRASSGQGEENGVLALDLSKIKLALRLIENRQTDADLLKGLGGELYQALFPNKVNGHWRATKAAAEAAESGVRLRLIFEEPEITTLPWEFLYDEGTNTFLASDIQTALSRYIDVPLTKRDLASAGRPLKILLVISSPTNLPPLDVDGEEVLIREALSKHIDTSAIELDVLREATIRNVTQQLRVKPYNVFHFIGHGDFERDRGAIALIDADGTAKLLDEENFSNFFLGNRGIGLAVLNSCRGASSSSYRAMAGVAPNLVRRGLPAVIAMQYNILDTTAKQFADEFYRTLALGWPVDAAMQTTRNAISIEAGLDKPDFATPVLYMRAKDGVILSGL